MRNTITSLLNSPQDYLDNLYVFAGASAPCAR